MNTSSRTLKSRWDSSRCTLGVSIDRDPTWEAKLGSREPLNGTYQGTKRLSGWTWFHSPECTTRLTTLASRTKLILAWMESSRPKTQVLSVQGWQNLEKRSSRRRKWTWWSWSHHPTLRWQMHKWTLIATCLWVTSTLRMSRTKIVLCQCQTKSCRLSRHTTSCKNHS